MLLLVKWPHTYDSDILVTVGHLNEQLDLLSKGFSPGTLWLSSNKTF